MKTIFQITIFIVTITITGYGLAALNHKFPPGFSCHNETSTLCR